MTKISSILFLSIIMTSCFYTTVPDTEAVSPMEKIRGVSLEGSSKPLEANFFDEIVDINGNWVSLMPYAYGKNDDPELIYKNLKWQWWGEGKLGSSKTIEYAQSKGIKTMLKPHLWLGHGDFTGELTMDSEKDWRIWEEQYRQYVLGFAHLADSLNVEIFCIGTELESFTQERPEFWRNLISEIRTFYDGKLTYAANWNEYTTFPFWNELDFIGIDAYFPISTKNNPSVEDLMNGWKKWNKEMKLMSEKLDKPIIFTEYGYQSVDNSTITPWHANQEGNTNFEEQRNAYEALYKSCWNEPWMKGGFLWKWHVSDHQPEKKLKQFTPQFKPALDVIREWYNL